MGDNRRVGILRRRIVVFERDCLRPRFAVVERYGQVEQRPRPRIAADRIVCQNQRAVREFYQVDAAVVVRHVGRVERTPGFSVVFRVAPVDAGVATAYEHVDDSRLRFPERGLDDPVSPEIAAVQFQKGRRLPCSAVVAAAVDEYVPVFVARLAFERCAGQPYAVR